MKRLLLYITYGCLSVVTVRSQDQSCDRRLGESCYVLRPSTTTWKPAAELCRALGAHLVTVTSQEEGQVLSELVDERGLNGAWLGLRERFTPWTWLTGELVFEQGCYKLQSDRRDVGESQTTLDGNSFEFCEQICRNDGFKFGALADGDKCLCGDRFVSYETSDNCNIVCSGSLNAGRTCGGQAEMEVFAVNGVYSGWLPGQPNNFEGYQVCAHIEVFIDDNNNLTIIGWSDTECRSLLGVVCQLSPETCDDIQLALPDVDTENLFLHSNQTCYLVKRNERQQSFFTARQYCRSLGGELPILNTQEKSEELIQFIQENLDLITVKDFWIGLSRSRWLWTTDEELLYTNWKQESPGSPNGVSQECVGVWAGTDVWDDVSCDETEMSVICEYDPRVKIQGDESQGITTTSDDITTGSGLTSTVNRTTTPPSELTDVDYAIIAGISSGLLVILLLVIPLTCYAYKKKSKLIKEKLEDANRERYFFGFDVTDTKENPAYESRGSLADSHEEHFTVEKDTDSPTHKPRDTEDDIRDTIAELEIHVSNISLAQGSTTNSDRASSVQVQELEVVGERPDLLTGLESIPPTPPSDHS